MAPDYYEVLAILPGASTAEVRRAWRTLRQGLRAEAPVVQSMYAPEEAEAIHARIDEAFRILTDGETARRYEKYHRAGRAGSSIPRSPDAFFDAVHDLEGPMARIVSDLHEVHPKVDAPKERGRIATPLILTRTSEARATLLGQSAPVLERPAPPAAQTASALETRADLAFEPLGIQLVAVSPSANAASDFEEDDDASLEAPLAAELTAEPNAALDEDPPSLNELEEVEELDVIAPLDIAPDSAVAPVDAAVIAATVATAGAQGEAFDDEADSDRVLRIEFTPAPVVPVHSPAALVPPRPAPTTPFFAPAAAELPIPRHDLVRPAPEAPRPEVMRPAASAPAWDAPERAPSFEPAPRTATGLDPTTRKLPGAVVGVLADTQQRIQAVAVDLQPRTSYRPWNRDTVRTRAVGPLQIEPLTPSQVEELASDCGGYGGAFFQQARRKLGVSIEDIAERTKIMTTMLRAIEDNKLDDLPAPVYVKGYLQQVARLLRLPQPEVVDGWLKHNQMR